MLPFLRFEVRRPVRDVKFELCGIGFFRCPPAVVGDGADGFEGFDVERRVGRWGYREETFPETVEAEEEFSRLSSTVRAAELTEG